MSTQAGDENNTKYTLLEELDHHDLGLVERSLYLGYNILIVERIQFLHGLFSSAVVFMLFHGARTSLPRRGALERHDDASPAKEPKDSGFDRVRTSCVMYTILY